MQSLCDKTVNTFVQKYPTTKYLRDDLKSEAYLIWLDKPQLDEKQLRVAVWRHCVKFVQEQPAFGPSHETARLNGAPARESMPELEDAPAADGLLLEILEHCESDFERDVIERRAQKMTDAEIAAELSSSESTVRRARDTVAERFHNA